MTPTSVLFELLSRGVEVAADGDILRFGPAALVDDALRQAMVCYKQDLLKLVRLGIQHLPLEWRIEWEQRAAIMEYDGGLSRDQAEHTAMTDILQTMENQSCEDQ